jgi:hypothetical protein
VEARDPRRARDAKQRKDQTKDTDSAALMSAGLLRLDLWGGDDGIPLRLLVGECACL